jgi:hypothetical protein
VVLETRVVNIGEVCSNYIEWLEVAHCRVGRGYIHANKSKGVRMNKLHFGKSWGKDNNSNAPLGITGFASSVQGAWACYMEDTPLVCVAQGFEVVQVTGLCLCEHAHIQVGSKVLHNIPFMQFDTTNITVSNSDTGEGGRREGGCFVSIRSRTGG